jgi:hypothetical protein
MERFEQLARVLWFDAHARIRHGESHTDAVVTLDPDQHLPRAINDARHCVHGVEKQLPSYSPCTISCPQLRPPGKMGENLHQEPLFRRSLVGIVKGGTTRRKIRMTLEEFVARKHVVAGTLVLTNQLLEKELRRHGATLKVGIDVPYLLAVPSLVATSDFIAAVPEERGSPMLTCFRCRSRCPISPCGSSGMRGITTTRGIAGSGRWWQRRSGSRFAPSPKFAALCSPDRRAAAQG